MELRSRKKSKTTSDTKSTADSKPKGLIKPTPSNPQKLLFKPFGIVDIFQFIIVSLVLASIMSYLTTETLFYHYDFPKIDDFNSQSWFQSTPPQQLRNFTLSELAEFDGANGKPIYLAIKGKVYDVSSKPSAYGPEGGYKFFSAKDASRAYGTGCFQDHLTHDLRGLTDDQLKAVEDWAAFFENKDDYPFIGRVKLPKPTGPIPEDCNKKNEKEEEIVEEVQVADQHQINK